MEDPIVESFSKAASPEFQDIILRLVAIISTSPYPLDMQIKWGQLTFASGADFHHWICAIKITKKFIGLSFHFGGLLNDPDSTFKTGSSKFLRAIEYRSVGDINETAILDFIAQALDRLQYFKENWKEIQKSA